MILPSPTFCPECRLQRRLSFYNLINLFYRDCDLCHEQYISMYPPEADCVVYCPTCWWSDKWDFRDYAQEYDFNRNFFEQYSELLHRVPLMGLALNVTTIQGYLYNNYTTYAKNSYLTFNSDNIQDCAYGTSLTRSRESFDSSMVMDTDTCYDCMCIYKSNKCIGTRGNNRFCIDCSFVRDCENCQDCFMCSGLKNQKYCYKNKQLSKDEYRKIRDSYDLGSYEVYKNAQVEAEEFYNTLSPKPAWDTLSVNCTGSYVFHSKNCHECFDVVDSEDCRYCMMLWRTSQKDCYDTTLFGENLELIYESLNIFENARNVHFSLAVGINSFDIEYSALAISGSYQFGCVGARKGEYCILNKQYSKKDYFEMVEKIKKQMNDMPYLDGSGNSYTYGEFLPMNISPFPYNKSFAELFFPLSEKEMHEHGGEYLQEEKRTYSITKVSTDIRDHIKDIPENPLDEVYECITCKKGYKVIEMELHFLKKMNVPFPRECLFCRIKSKLLLWVDNMRLKPRMCNNCGIVFKTHFGENRAKIIYCKDCWKKEYR
jgi:hypothetical protein